MVVSQNTTGVTTNPYRMIQATEKIGNGADVVNNSDASFGLVASVTGPGKTIMDTGYFPFNEFIGAHHLDIRWYSNISSGYGMTLQYWKMDINGVETLCRSVDIDWHSDISDEFGNSAGGGWFNQNYQYRFVVISHATVPLTSYVAIDFLKLTSENPWSVGVQSLHGGPSGAPNNPVLMQVQVPVTVSGGYSYTTVVTVTGWTPNMASIVGVSPLQDIILAVTSSDSTTFTFTLTHRAGTTWSYTNLMVNFLVMTTDYYYSL